MEFPPPYFGGDEPVDDRLYDFYPMTMSFDPIRFVRKSGSRSLLIDELRVFLIFRYRGHGPRYDPSGYH